ncbi:MAG: aminodeoxychorismate lyase [Thiobacillaceae bacterium]|nr:aminodeoxychorismate lyase [Thiobacillaceae bacterium]
MDETRLSLIDGEARALLGVHDRGLMYGDGVFRTIRVRDGRPLWWADQLGKLAADAHRLGIAMPEPALWARDVDRLLAQAPAECVLKLVLTRGPATRGYRPVPASPPTRIVMVSPMPAQIEAVAARGARLHLCRLRLAEQPALAGIKHLNRLENVLAAAEFDPQDYDEGLLLDTAGRVVGGVRSNLFVYRAGRLRTPRLERCGVAGVARARLLALAARLKLPVCEDDIGLEEVLEADELWLSNSLIRLWPVSRLGSRLWQPSHLAYSLRAQMDDD